MEISIHSQNGERCRNERHQFRIGIDDRDVTEFSATEHEFPEALTNAILDHGANKRAGWNGVCLHLQVLTERSKSKSSSWCNCQNPKTGGVVAVTPKIAGQNETAQTLFLWCCNSVQMVRDIGVLASGLAREATE